MTPENARRLRSMAEQLAALIDTLTGLTPEQRCDLRMLPCDMIELADREAGVEAPEAPDMHDTAQLAATCEEAIDILARNFIEACDALPPEFRDLIAANAAGEVVANVLVNMEDKTAALGRIMRIVGPVLLQHGLIGVPVHIGDERGAVH